MSKPQSPCEGCTPEKGRCAVPNCHTRCELYLEYEAKKNEYAAAVRAAKRGGDLALDFRVEQQRKRKKKAHGK